MRLIILLALFCPLLSMCQPLSLKGKVINELGEPIQGATITLKRPPTPDTKLQTPNPPSPSSVIYHQSSDSNGEFTITDLHLNDTLVISAVGYEPHTLIYDHTYTRYPQLTVWLKRRVSQLREVVVNTGYQQLPRERATGSFTQVGNSTFNQQVSTDVLSRLEAVATGLTVDRTTAATGRLAIRGLSTIRGPKEPLVILDNFPYNGNIQNINPADVESITILKDAAAASIWGARAGNGVIVITTKKGRFNQPLTVELTTGIILTAEPDLGKIQQMASADFVDVEQFLFSKGFYNSRITNTARPPLSPVVEMLLKRAAGTVSQAELDNYLAAVKSVDVRDGFSQHMYRQGFTQQYNLSLRGGAESFSWLFSGGYDRSRSVLDAPSQRVTGRWESAFMPLKGLRLSTALTYTGTNGSNGKPGYGAVPGITSFLYPYAQFAGEDGAALPVARGYRQAWLDTAGGGRLLDWRYYPLTDHLFNTTQNTGSSILVNAGLQYALPIGLRLSLDYQYESQQAGVRNEMAEGSYATRDLVNTFTQVNYTTGGLTYKLPRGSILDLSGTELRAHSARAGLSFNRTGRVHSLAFLAGAEGREAGTETYTFRTYGYNPDLRTLTNVDYTTLYPSFVNGASRFIPANHSFVRTLNRHLSFFANAAWTFRDRYTLSASARKDASNLFGVATNRRWNPFWSAGAAWELSKESFYHLAFLPYLRLRATYGYSGNTDPSIAALTTITYLSASPYTGSPYARFQNVANPELRWEKIATTNLALDFRTAANTVWGSIEYYRKRGRDLFGFAPVDYTTGIGSTVTKNVAGMQGSGFDIELTSNNTRGAVAWSTNLAASWNRDKITSYYLTSLAGRNFVSAGAVISGLEGKPVYSVFSYRWAGLDPATGDPRGFKDGHPSNDYTALMGSNVMVSDLAYHGPALPTVFGSLGNTVTYKQFSLTVRLLYKMGHYFRRTSISYTALVNNGQGHPDYALRWQAPGDEARTVVPSFVYPANSNRDAFYSSAEPLVERADHLRLQYINLAYDWKPGFKGARQRVVQFNANLANGGILWRRSSEPIDPEYPVLPPSPTLAFGLRASL